MGSILNVILFCFDLFFIENSQSFSKFYANLLSLMACEKTSYTPENFSIIQSVAEMPAD